MDHISCKWLFIINCLCTYTRFVRKQQLKCRHTETGSLFNTSWSDSCNAFLDPGSTKLHGWGILSINVCPRFTLVCCNCPTSLGAFMNSLLVLFGDFGCKVNVIIALLCLSRTSISSGCALLLCTFSAAISHQKLVQLVQWVAKIPILKLISGTEIVIILI